MREEHLRQRSGRDAWHSLQASAGSIYNPRAPERRLGFINGLALHPSAGWEDGIGLAAFHGLHAVDGRAHHVEEAALDGPHCRKCSGRAMLCVFVMNGRATCDPYTWMWNAVEGGLKPPNGDQADTRSAKSQVTLAKCARNTCDKGADGTPGTRCKRAPDPSITLAHPSAGWGSSMASRYTRARVGGARRGGDARGRPHHRHGARRGPSLSQVFRPFVTVRSFHERPGHL